MCVCVHITKKHTAAHATARQSLRDSNKNLFFFSEWLPDSTLKSATYALYSPGWIRLLWGLSLSDSGASGMANWTAATAGVPTCVIWIKVSIYVSAPVMRRALSCTSCINFLFVWVQSVPHPASVTSSALSLPPPPRGARRGCRKCIRSAGHWVTRSMVARWPGLADGVPAVAAAVFKAPRIYGYSLNPHGGSKR